MPTKDGLAGPVEDGKRKWKVVQYLSYNEIYLKCGCVMFETLGILCKHALFTLKKKKVMNFPTNTFWVDGLYLSGIYLVVVYR